MNEQLIISAEKGDVERVLMLLEDGADINATDRGGRTAVVAATYNNRTEVVKALIENGADINIRDHRLNNVLLYAGAEGYLDIVKLAIDAGADTRLTNRFGGIAVIPASERGHVEVVEELLSRSDTDVNHVNNLHWTALLEAVILGNGGEKHQQIVRLLISHGADLNIADRDGLTPLMHARQRGFREIADILTEAGALPER
ncbi:ankyrin repeat domain-containing protein [Cohnella sp. GCM10012308]|uniref:ankyrin repeat domain-containing protein n=1 Tax=Cohnella sp. GCM10012308 TaxID=3317329 RepID=UPI0036169727